MRHTGRGLQGRSLVVVDISDAKQAHDVQVLRFGVLREIGRLVLTLEHRLVLGQRVIYTLRRLHQPPAAMQLHQVVQRPPKTHFNPIRDIILHLPYRLACPADRSMTIVKSQKALQFVEPYR